jgi:formate/nitrite transporter FocA (FNT family)
VNRRRLDLPQEQPELWGDELLDQEPEHIAGRAVGVGRERLGRSLPDMAITAVIGGIEVSLGVLAAMLVLGAATEAVQGLGLYGGLALGGLVFPVGFVMVVVGRSELFTENFLIPVISALNQEPRAPRRLTELWLLSLLGNLAGCLLVALLLTVPEAVGTPLLRGYALYSIYKLSLPFPGLLVSAVLAGMLMTVLTWMMLAVRSTVGKILVIWAAGYALFATNLSHVIVSAAVIFVGFHLTGYGVLDVLRYLGVTTLGNLVGGVGLVTLFRIAQVHEKQRRRARTRPP